VLGLCVILAIGNLSLVKAVMQDVSWISERWMVVIQNQTVMSVFVDNMTFTFRRSDCDLKKASDNEFDRGLGYLVTWKTRYTWVPGKPVTPGYLEHHVSFCLTEDLGYSKSRGFVVCQSLLCCQLELHDS